MEEVLARMKTISGWGQQRMMLVMAGWVSCLPLDSLAIAQRESFLRAFVVLTLTYAESRVDLIQKLWQALAFTPENASIIIRFLLSSIDKQVRFYLS